MSQYHKAIFIQNSLGKISTRTYWRQSYLYNSCYSVLDSFLVLGLLTGKINGE